MISLIATTKSSKSCVHIKLCYKQAKSSLESCEPGHFHFDSKEMILHVGVRSNCIDHSKKSLTLQNCQEQSNSQIIERANYIVNACQRYQISHISLDFIDVTHVSMMTKVFLERFIDIVTYKSNTKQHKLTKVEFLAEEKHHRDIEDSFEHELYLITGKQLSYRLAQTPANHCRIKDIVAKAQECFGDQCEVINEKQLSKIGARCLLAVGKASKQESQALVIKHCTKSAKKSTKKPTIALVGKGVVYDTGGLNLKPHPYMSNMYKDMTGAASVIGCMHALQKLDLPVNVIAFIGLVENSIGSDAYRPGDILESLSGKTVEVANTDAEGRLVLCDLMSYAQQYKPDTIITVATLTGGIVHALGKGISGAFGTDLCQIEQLLYAANREGESLWPMPLPYCYNNTNYSDQADLSNLPSRQSGAGHIGAAMFLREFALNTKFIHLDIARVSDLKAKDNASMRGLYVDSLVSFIKNFS